MRILERQPEGSENLAAKIISCSSKQRAERYNVAHIPDILGRQHGALVTTHWGKGGSYPVGRGKTSETSVCLPSLSTKRKCTKTKTACKLAETFKLSLPECTSNEGDQTPMLTGIAP